MRKKSFDCCGLWLLVFFQLYQIYIINFNRQREKNFNFVIQTFRDKKKIESKIHKIFKIFLPRVKNGLHKLYTKLAIYNNKYV